MTVSLDSLRCLDEEIAHWRERALAAEKRLQGLKPELPPRPPEGDGLPRYGLRWNGPTEPLPVPMADGYWTPWHLAERYRARVAELEAIRHLVLFESGWYLVEDHAGC